MTTAELKIKARKEAEKIISLSRWRCTLAAGCWEAVSMDDPDRSNEIVLERDKYHAIEEPLPAAGSVEISAFDLISEPRQPGERPREILERLLKMAGAPVVGFVLDPRFVWTREPSADGEVFTWRLPESTALVRETWYYPAVGTGESRLKDAENRKTVDRTRVSGREGSTS